MIVLTPDQIRQAHAFVPVIFWPVLWVSLIRLWATFHLLTEEGRRQVLVKFRRNGTLYIAWVGESEAERRARLILPETLVRAPWKNLSPDRLDALFRALGAGSGAGAGLGLSHDTAMIPWRYPHETRLIPPGAPAPALHPP